MRRATHRKLNSKQNYGEKRVKKRKQLLIQTDDTKYRDQSLKVNETSHDYETPPPDVHVHTKAFRVREGQAAAAAAAAAGSPRAAARRPGTYSLVVRELMLLPGPQLLRVGLVVVYLVIVRWRVQRNGTCGLKWTARCQHTRGRMRVASAHTTHAQTDELCLLQRKNRERDVDSQRTSVFVPCQATTQPPAGSRRIASHNVLPQSIH